MGYLSNMFSFFNKKNLRDFERELNKYYSLKDENEDGIKKVLSRLLNAKGIPFEDKFEIIKSRYLTNKLSKKDLNKFVENVINSEEIQTYDKNIYSSELFNLGFYDLHHKLKAEVFGGYNFKETLRSFHHLSGEKRLKYSDFIADLINNQKSLEFNFYDTEQDDVDSNLVPFTFASYYLEQKNYEKAINILKNHNKFVQHHQTNHFSNFNDVTHYIYQTKSFLDINFLKELNKQDALFLLASEALYYKNETNKIGNIYGALCECYFKYKESRELTSKELKTSLSMIEDFINEYEIKNPSISKNDKTYNFKEILSLIKIVGNFNTHAKNFIDLIHEGKINIGEKFSEIFHEMIIKNYIEMDLNNTKYFMESFSFEQLKTLTTEEQYLLYLNAYKNSSFENNNEKSEFDRFFRIIFNWKDNHFKSVRYFLLADDNNINKSFMSEKTIDKKIYNTIFFHIIDDKVKDNKNDIEYINMLINSLAMDFDYGCASDDLIKGVECIYNNLNQQGFDNEDIHPLIIKMLNKNNKTYNNSEDRVIDILEDDNFKIEELEKLCSTINMDIFKDYLDNIRLPNSLFQTIVASSEENKNMKRLMVEIEKKKINELVNVNLINPDINRKIKARI